MTLIIISWPKIRIVTTWRRKRQRMKKNWLVKKTKATKSREKTRYSFTVIKETISRIQSVKLVEVTIILSWFYCSILCLCRSVCLFVSARDPIFPALNRFSSLRHTLQICLCQTPAFFFSLLNLLKTFPFILALYMMPCDMDEWMNEWCRDSKKYEM